MTLQELEGVMNAVGTVMKAFVAQELAPVLSRLDALDQKALLPGPAGKDGIDGKNADLADLSDLRARVGSIEGVIDTRVELAVMKAMANRPPVINGKDGLNGRDVDMAAVASLVDSAVTKAVSSLPVPKDGRDGKDGTDGKDGEPGVNGKDASPEAIAGLRHDLAMLKVFVDTLPETARPADVTQLRNDVEARFKALPIPKDGRDGVDGKNAELPDIAGIVAAQVRTAVADIPTPKDGQPGRDGINGKDAVLPDVAAIVRSAVKAEVGSLPLPKDGKSVTVDELAPVVHAEVQKAVAALPRPADPVNVTGALIERDGTLVLTCSDGSTKRVGQVVGKDGSNGLDGKDVSPDRVTELVKAAIDQIPRPENGKDGDPGRDGVNGKDGLGFDDLAMVFDDAKGHRLQFKRGDEVREYPIAIPFYADVWRTGKAYVKGATVTYKGSQFIAVEDTNTEPEQSRSWRLVVKRGRDGKDGAS